MPYTGYPVNNNMNMGWMNNGYSPTQIPNNINWGQPQQTQMQSPVRIAEVHGKEGAQTYNLPPNSSILLLDQTDSVVWLKKTDDAGYATLNKFYVTPAEQVEQNQYNALENRLSNIENQFDQLQNQYAQIEERINNNGKSYPASNAKSTTNSNSKQSVNANN